MSAHNYLAFDLGAESGRAVLGSLENGKLTLGEIHRFARSLDAQEPIDNVLTVELR